MYDYPERVTMSNLFSYCPGVWGNREITEFAKVAELVDALDLGFSAARRESSSLSFRTIMYKTNLQIDGTPDGSNS